MPLKAGSIFQFTCLENFDTLKIMNLASNFRRRDAKKLNLQKAQLSQKERAMRRVSWNLANCHATMQKLHRESKKQDT